MTLRHLVLEREDGNYRANPKELVILKYYANAIAHLFDAAALVAARFDSAAGFSSRPWPLMRFITRWSLGISYSSR